MTTGKSSLCFVRRVVGVMIVTAIVLSASLAQATVLIIESVGESYETHIFSDGVYYQCEDDQFTGSFDLTRDRCMSISHENRRYFVGGCKDLLESNSQLMTESYEEHKKELGTDEEYEVMQKTHQAMIAQMNSKQLTVKSLGKDIHLGFPAERYELRYEDKPVKEIWASTVLHEMIQKEFDLDSYHVLSSKFQEVFKEIAGLDMSDPISREMDKLEQKGYLVKVLPIIGAEEYFKVALTGLSSMLLQKEVITIEPKSKYNISTLVVPEGYKKSASWKEYLRFELLEN